MKINLILIRCSECKKYRSFGNGYGECSIFRHTMKDKDFCSYAEWRDAGYDDHDHSGLIEE